MKQVLFVCTGNSCRSVMAQGFLEHLIHQQGNTEVQVASAGLFAMDGMGASRETQKLLQEMNIDSSAHRARSLNMDMVDHADLIFVMEHFQRQELERRYPYAKEKVHLLKTYGLTEILPEDRQNVLDPMGKPLEVYEVRFAEIREAVERIARSLGIGGSA